MATKAATVAADPIVEIERLRGQIAALQAEIAELGRQNILRPQAESELHIRELVRRSSLQARVPLEQLLTENLARLKKPNFDSVAEILNSRKPFDVLCLLMPAAVEQRLLEAISAAYAEGGDEVMSAEDQGERRRVLEERLFDVELEEERLISQLELQSRPAPQRRGDAHPAAVLHPSTLSDEME